MDSRTTAASENGSSEAVSPTVAYGRQYYEAYGDPGHRGYCRKNWLGNFRCIADQIVSRLHPRKTLDVGCAKGFLVECLRDQGVEAFGFDVSEYAIGEVRSDIRPYCWVASAADSINDFYDVITCIEVCEHLPDWEAQEATRHMTSHTDVILFSSTPGHFQDPTHVNIHPIIDWLRLFARFSFAPDEQFDARFVAPQAMLLRRVDVPPSDHALARFAYARNRAIVADDLANSPEARDELEAILSLRGWKFIAFCLYRRLRLATERSLAHGLRTLKSKFRVAGEKARI